MANFPNASSVVPDKIQTEDIPKVLRNIYTQIARNVASQDREIAQLRPGVGKDNRLADMRVAHSLKGMAHNIEIIDPGNGLVGDVLYLVDQYHAMFGSAANPGSGGSVPAAVMNPLLDGANHTDTVAQGATKGSMIVGNSTPKWDELVVGANGFSPVADSTTTLGVKWANPKNVLIDGLNHTDTVGSASPVRGDIIVRSAAGLWDMLSGGAADTFIKFNGNDPVYSAALGKTGAAKIDLTNQSAAIGVTNLIAAPAAGLYRVSHTLLVTTADVTAGAIQLSIGYTDTLGATTQVSGSLVLTATGRTSGTMVTQIASGALTYQVIVAGAVNAARYALFVRVEYIG